MTPEHTKRIDVFLSSIKPQSNCIYFRHYFFDFFAELQMAKSHFARWHLTNKYKTFARGTLWELILIGEPSGNPGEPSGNPSPSQGNSRGTHPRETSGHRRGSQISNLDSNLKSHFKNVRKPMFFATICNLPVRCHLHSCLLHIYLSQTF